MQAGDRLGGRIVTNPRTRGPVFDVVPLTSNDRLSHLALLYPPAVLAHPWFKTELAGYAKTFGGPGVVGVAPLVQAEVERGALVFETGPALPLAQIFGRLASAGRTLGVRASLELAYLCADTLVHADDALGVPHGQLNPWTIALTDDGNPVLLDYGVPSVEFDLDRPGSGFTLREDSVRYAPPERFGPDPIDLRSDLFALWLVVAEGVLGGPLYDGQLEDLRHQARRGDASARWNPHRDRVSQEFDVLITAGLRPDWDARRTDPVRVVHDLYALARRGDADGASLVDVVRSVWDSGGSGGPSPLSSPRQAAVDALDPDAKWSPESGGPRTLYDPRTGITSALYAAEKEGRAASRPGRADDRDARRAALRERLKGGPTHPMPAGGAPAAAITTDTVLERTDYVTLDPITAATVKGDPRASGGPSTQTTHIVERADAAAAAPADVSWRIVAHRDRAVRVAIFEPDHVATVALRAAVELGSVTADTTGRLLCGWTLSQGGRRWSGSEPASALPSGVLELLEVPVELRLVTIQVETSPPLRFRSPTSLAMPAAWFVSGIVQWLGLPEAQWAAHVRGRPIDRDVLLADAIGGDDLVVLAVRGRP